MSGTPKFELYKKNYLKIFQKEADIIKKNMVNLY